jgi:DNA invertase Pin-like site-specific DNA recombinase
MRIGYARTSTTEQDASIKHQIASLKAAGCEKVYQEQVSAVALEARTELRKALEALRADDVLVCTSLSRLARSTAHLLRLVDDLEAQGASLQVLDMNLDTGTSTGKLILSVIGSINQFERELMLERQRIGIAKAKVEGKYKGRKPTAREKAPKVIELAEKGLKKEEISQLTGIGVASVYRILAEHKALKSSDA